MLVAQKTNTLRELTTHLPRAERIPYDFSIQVGNCCFPLVNLIPHEKAKHTNLTIISHPGWVRFLGGKDRYGVEVLDRQLHPKVAAHIKSTYRNLSVSGVESVDLDTRVALVHLGLTQMPEVLVSEVRTEDALASAIKNRHLIVLSLQAIETETGICLASCGNRLYYQEFLQSFHKASKNIYILPTEVDHGIVLGGLKHYMKNAEIESISDQYGDIFRAPWRKIFFCGGFPSYCLKDTARYFSLAAEESNDCSSSILNRFISSNGHQFVYPPLIEGRPLSIKKQCLIAEKFISLSAFNVSSTSAFLLRKDIESLLKGYFWEEDINLFS